MAKPKPTARNPIRKRLHVGTTIYPATATRYRESGPVPYIRLRGHWLAAAGFSPADALEIVATPGKLVITRV